MVWAPPAPPGLLFRGELLGVFREHTADAGSDLVQLQKAGLATGETERGAGTGSPSCWASRGWGEWPPRMCEVGLRGAVAMASPLIGGMRTWVRAGAPRGPTRARPWAAGTLWSLRSTERVTSCSRAPIPSHLCTRPPKPNHDGEALREASVLGGGAPLGPLS